MAKKKKLVTAVVAVATAAALTLGGTFAWQSISQTALNEASDVINPGGRLHDDFYIDDNGNYNADIYVENFAEDEIFARVRLEEYMEVVINYGTEAALVETLVGSTEEVDSDSINIGSKADGTQYERVYALYSFDGNAAADADGAATGDYSAAIDGEANAWFSWTPGSASSETVYYMPTFNMNKDSLVADRNGMYVDRIGGISNRGADQYENYTVWSDGDIDDGTEIYDVDNNTLDEVGYRIHEDLTEFVDAGNIKTVAETHTAAPVGTTNGLISMSEWIDKWDNGEDTADYWVYDTDGWVYWSSPIGAKSTTGLLLDAIELNQVMDDTWYYAINVIGQFCTAGDVDGFYNDGEAPSSDAEILLEEIGAGTGEAADDEDGEDETLYSTIDLWHDGDDTVSGGEFLIFEAEVYDENGDVIAFTDDVTFSVEEVNGSETAAMALFESTTMEGNALMVADEIVNSGVTQPVVTANYTDDSGISYEGTYELDVAEGESPLSISLKIDGKDVSYYRPGIYQMFPANPAADTYSFSASLNDVPTSPVWSAAYTNEDAPFTTTIGDDGIQTISTSAEWDNDWAKVPAGTNIAQINTNTGEFKVLLNNQYYPRSMEFYITASDESSGYENTVLLCLYRVDVNFNLLNADVADQNSIDAYSATYTAGKDSVINLSFDLMMNGETAEVNMGKLQNWKLYEGYASYNGTLIDSSKYEITTDAANHTAKLTIPANSGIDAEELQLTVEYNHGVIAPRTEDGISEGTLNITEANAAADAGTVERFVITDDNGEEEATYTPGKYQKIKLTASALTADEEPVYSGYVSWYLVGSDGASTTVDNVTLKSNGFEAEVWLTGATAETITVKAQYEGESGGIDKDDTFVITAEQEESGGETNTVTITTDDGTLDSLDDTVTLQLNGYESDVEWSTSSEDLTVMAGESGAATVAFKSFGAAKAPSAYEYTITAADSGNNTLATYIVKYVPTSYTAMQVEAYGQTVDNTEIEYNGSVHLSAHRYSGAFCIKETALVTWSFEAEDGTNYTGNGNYWYDEMAAGTYTATAICTTPDGTTTTVTFTVTVEDSGLDM